MKVFAVIGSKDSGKTTTIEILTEELTKRGYKVAAVKHIPESNFTMDKEGKDTWRFAESGAKTIVSVASTEVTVIEKTNATALSLEEISRKCEGNDVIFLEGFRRLVGKNSQVPKIVAVKSADEALEASRNIKSILVFTGPYSTEPLNLNVPYIDVLRNRDKIVDLVEDNVRKK